MTPRVAMASFRLAVALVLSIAGLRAQEEASPASVEGRLLEILRERRVIDASEYEELRKLEADLRRDADIEARLDAKVDAMVARLADEAPKTAYKPGKGFSWTTADGNFNLTIGGFVQARFQHTEYDDDVAGSKFDEGEPLFDAPRARLWLEGHAFQPYWKYKIAFDAAGDTARGPFSSTGGNPAVTSSGAFTSQNRLTELKDAYIEFAKWKPFNLRLGQFKVPYSRQQLTAVPRQQFVDRAITDRVFAPARNHGLMAYGSLGGEKEDVFEYAFGVFNGEGENFINNDDGLFWVGRMVVNPLGGVPYSEGDHANSGDFKIALGVNAYFHDNDNHNQAGARFDTWSLGADLAMVWGGWSFAAELHYREDEQANDDRESLGWYAQLGYFLIPKEFEIALRAAEIDFDNSTSATAQREYLGVLGWFFEGHNLKLQADFGRVELHEVDGSRDDDEWRLRFQAQIVF